MTNEELKRITVIETKLALFEKALSNEGIRVPSDPEDEKSLIQAASKAQLGK